LREFSRIFAGDSLDLTDLKTEGITADVEETGQTFEANAVLKAIAYRDMSGLAALADDSGLVVDALDGRPGVRSARYAGQGDAGENATDAENVARLTEELKDIPLTLRTARFECVIAVAMPGKAVVTFTGSVAGTIAEAPRGDGGFGYDPVFLLPNSGAQFGGMTMAQLSPEEKGGLSHRGLAAGKAARWLRSLEAAPEYN
jgi:XTP/dITP diphosphohydrolase